MKPWSQTPKSLTRLLLVSALALPAPFIMTGCNNSADSSEATSHISRAETYADQGQYRSALIEVQNAIQTDPNNVDHIVRLAKLYLTVGASEQASELLQPWMTDHPQEVALPLARAYLEQGKQLSAKETLDGYSPDSPKTQLQVSLIRAEAMRLSGEVPEALALFRSLLDSYGSNIKAVTGVARSHLDLNQAGQAARVLEEWISQNGPNAQVLYWEGIAQYRENQLEVASETLTEAVTKLPTSDMFLPIRRDLLTALSRVLTEQGKITEAQIYNRILAENLNTSANEQGEAAIAAIREGNYEEAKNILRDILKLDPDNEQVALMLGALAAGTGDRDEGIRLLTENVDPETTPTRFIRAATMAKIDSGDREEAVQTLERAVKARPNDNELLAMHGILALTLPDHEEAGVASLSKAISNEPERVRLRLALAQYHLRNNQPEQALGQLRMAFTTDPSDWNTTGAYLTLLIQKGETSEAAEVRDSLLNGYPNEPFAVLLASMADAELGETEKAKTRLELLVKENPELQAPRIALANLHAQAGQNEQAATLLVDAAKMTPDTLQPLQQAVRVLAGDRSRSEIYQWLETVGRENPELSKNADVLLALISIRQGDLAQARSLLDEWQGSDSASIGQARVELLAAEARAAANSANYTTARSKAAEAIALKPDNLNLAMLSVNFAALEGDNEKALNILEEVETTFGESGEIVRARARLLGRADRPEEAISVLETYYQKSADITALSDLINFTLRTDSGKADTYSEEWVIKAPDNPAAHLSRAEYLMQQGREVEAASHYEQVLKQLPENTVALNNLAWTLRERDRKRALEIARRATELSPETGAVLDTYGWLLHLNGQHKAAEEQIKKALQLEPENKQIAQHLKAVQQAL